MDIEPKPLAALSAGLLARKGDARPAMRRPFTGHGPVPTLSPSLQDDLGWNDMGHDDDDTDEMSLPSLQAINGRRRIELPSSMRPGATPLTEREETEVPPVVSQQRELADKLSADERPVEPVGAEAPHIAREPVEVPQTDPIKAEAPQAPVEVEKQRSRPEATPSSAPTGLSRLRASKAAFTLRLDPERHLRLRLACAVNNRSAQQIVTEALDAFLAGQPHLEVLAQQIPLDTGKGGKLLKSK